VKKTNRPETNRERRKQKGKAERAAERNFRREWPFVAIANSPCGCCQTDEMLFKSRESAVEAFAKAGLNHIAITDDNGTVHENVDTFYGFWEKGKSEGRGLGYLLGLVTGQKRWP
jgi:hypothetical protein